VEALVRLLARRAEDGDPVAHSLHERVGHLIAEAQSLALLGLRSTMRTLSGVEPGAGSSVRKLLGVEHEQRVQEIGIRVALGAARRDVVRMIVLQGMKLVWIGVILGLAAAYGITRLLGSLLYGVKSSDPATFAGVAVIVTLVAAVATFVPAHRASAIAPSDALRHQ